MPSTTVEFLKIAEIELDEAIEFYELEQDGLGIKFLQEIKNSISRISKFPKAYSLITNNLRGCLVRVYPYSIIYNYSNDTVLIIAIANRHRMPGYWQSRLQ